MVKQNVKIGDNGAGSAPTGRGQLAIEYRESKD
jgi:hypothetical protein